MFEAAWVDGAIRVTGWSLLHSLWQGTIVSFCAWAVLRLLPDKRASMRYATAYLGLLLAFGVPVATAWYQAGAAREDGAESAAAGPESAAASVVTTEGPPPRFWTAVVWPRLEATLPWIVGAWLLGVLLLSLRLTGGYLHLQSLRRQGSPVPERWQQTFEALVRRLRISGPVRLVASTKILVPFACGWLRPMVIVPAGMLTAIPIQQLETILVHELAHIRRHDFLLNLLQSAIEILFFYHPAVRWLSAQAQAERENCCDDVAVAVCGDPRLYARALAGLEHLRAAPRPLPAPPATGGSLLIRIRRLVAPPALPAGHGNVGPRLAAAALLFGALSLAGISVAAGSQLPGVEGEDWVATSELPATLEVWTPTPLQESRLEEACGDSGKLRRCIDLAAAQARLECVPGSPLALLWWKLGDRPRLEDGIEVRKVVRETAEVMGGRGPGAVAGGESYGAASRQTVRQVKVVPSRHLPRCSTAAHPN